MVGGPRPRHPRLSSSLPRGLTHRVGGRGAETTPILPHSLPRVSTLDRSRRDGGEEHPHGVYSFFLRFHHTTNGMDAIHAATTNVHPSMPMPSIHPREHGWAGEPTTTMHDAPSTPLWRTIGPSAILIRALSQTPAKLSNERNTPTDTTAKKPMERETGATPSTDAATRPWHRPRIAWLSHVETQRRAPAGILHTFEARVTRPSSRLQRKSATDETASHFRFRVDNNKCDGRCCRIRRRETRRSTRLDCKAQA